MCSAILHPSPTVWNGTATIFTKADYADWTLETNQDHISSNIWITRKDNQGIFNIAGESGYDYGISPSGTEWAYGTTADYASLTYHNWEYWCNSSPPGTINKDAVLHLIDDDIYIDIKFISWKEYNSGGGFSYQRSTDQSMPVELNLFTAFVKHNIVQLNWQTVTEVNNYGFEVERYQNSWQKIGFVSGNGNSNSTKNYSFKDDKISSGKFTYRLKQIDNSGQFVFSHSIDVDLTSPQNYKLDQNYPNPFNPSTTISFDLPQAENVKLTLYNLLGQKIRTFLNEFKSSGKHTINFYGSDLTCGIYIYRIEAGTYTQARKMTLLK